MLSLASTFGIELSFVGDGVRLPLEMPPTTITLKLFGSLREASGESTIQVELDEGARVEDVRKWLAERNPLVDKLFTFR